MLKLSERIRHDLPLTESEWAGTVGKPLRLLLGRGERGRRGRGSFLVPLHIPLLAALVVDSGNGILVLLVLLVMLLLALCSLRLSPGLKMLGMRAGMDLKDSPRVWCALIVDSGSGMCKACISSSCCVPCGCRQTQMPSIMAVADGWFLSTAPYIWQSLVLFGSCLRSTVMSIYWEKTSGNAVFSASWFESGYMLLPVFWCIVSVFNAMLGSQRSTLCSSHGVCVVDFPVVVRGLFPWSCCSADHSNSSVAVLGQGDRWPCCAGRAGFPMSFTCPLCAMTGARLRFAVAVHQQGCPHTCRGAEFDPMASQTIEFLLLPYTRWSMSLLCRSCEFQLPS